MPSVEINFEHGCSAIYDEIRALNKDAVKNVESSGEKSHKIIRIDKKDKTYGFEVAFDRIQSNSSIINWVNGDNRLILRQGGNLVNRDPRKRQYDARIILFGLIWNDISDLFLVYEHLERIHKSLRNGPINPDKIIIFIRMTEIEITGEHSYLEKVINSSNFFKLINLKFKKFFLSTNILLTFTNSNWSILCPPSSISNEYKTHWVDILKSQLNPTYFVPLNIFKSHLNKLNEGHVIDKIDDDEIVFLEEVPPRKSNFNKSLNE